jgi:hypothetical protein
MTAADFLRMNERSSRQWNRQRSDDIRIRDTKRVPFILAEGVYFN